MSKARLNQLGQGLYCGLPAGPWQAVENSVTGFIHILDVEGRQIARVDRDWVLAAPTARFIAQARLDLGFLVEEVLGCWERIGDLEGEVERLLRQAQTSATPAGSPEVGR